MLAEVFSACSYSLVIENQQLSVCLGMYFVTLDDMENLKPYTINHNTMSSYGVVGGSLAVLL